MARAARRPEDQDGDRREPAELTPERAARARALAPAYDYIRALVARWAAEDAERESGGEDQPT